MTQTTKQGGDVLVNAKQEQSNSLLPISNRNAWHRPTIWQYTVPLSTKMPTLKFPVTTLLFSPFFFVPRDLGGNHLCWAGSPYSHPPIKWPALPVTVNTSYFCMWLQGASQWPLLHGTYYILERMVHTPVGKTWPTAFMNNNQRGRSESVPRSENRV